MQHIKQNYIYFLLPIMGISPSMYELEALAITEDKNKVLLKINTFNNIYWKEYKLFQ